MTNTTFDSQGDTSISIRAANPHLILFQDCQFFVNTAIYIMSDSSNPIAFPGAIYITSETSSSIVYPIRMVNCLISKTTPIPRYNWDWVIKTSENVSLSLLNLTIGKNNTYYTSGHKEFDYHIGDDIDIAIEDFDHDFIDFNVKELYFTSGTTSNECSDILLIDTQTFKFFHNFLPNHGRILPGSTYNGSQH